MQPSIFTKIIKGEIPAHRVYEDQATLVFLDIHPVQPGHMLVVPKKQIDRLEDMPSADYQALMQTVKLMMRRAVEVFGTEYRPCLKTEGFDVPHVHVHIIPCRTALDFWNKPDATKAPDTELLADIAKRLRTE